MRVAEVLIERQPESFRRAANPCEMKNVMLAVGLNDHRVLGSDGARCSENQLTFIRDFQTGGTVWFCISSFSHLGFLLQHKFKEPSRTQLAGLGIFFVASYY
jgi:hypothetical protein